MRTPRAGFSKRYIVLESLQDLALCLVARAGDLATGQIRCASTLSIAQPSVTTGNAAGASPAEVALLGYWDRARWARATAETSRSQREKRGEMLLPRGVPGSSVRSCQTYLQPQLEGASVCPSNSWLLTSSLSDKYRTCVESRRCSEQDVKYAVFSRGKRKFGV